MVSCDLYFVFPGLCPSNFEECPHHFQVHPPHQKHFLQSWPLLLQLGVHRCPPNSIMLLRSSRCCQERLVHESSYSEYVCSEIILPDFSVFFSWFRLRGSCLMQQPAHECIKNTFLSLEPHSGSNARDEKPSLHPQMCKTKTTQTRKHGNSQNTMNHSTPPSAIVSVRPQIHQAPVHSLKGHVFNPYVGVSVDGHIQQTHFRSQIQSCIVVSRYVTKTCGMSFYKKLPTANPMKSL
eukprot:5232430-Amphidinium_carterae.3